MGLFGSGYKNWIIPLGTTLGIGGIGCAKQGSTICTTKAFVLIVPFLCRFWY